MKVLWVGDAACTSGFARCTKAACDALARAGHEVTVLAMNYFGRPDLAAQHSYPLWPAYDPLDHATDIFGIELLPRLAQRVKPDVIVLLNDPWNVPAYVESLKHAGVDLPPVVGWLAVDSRNQKGAQLNDYLEHAIVWTEFAAGEISRGGYKGPVTIVPLGVDLDQFCPVDQATARANAFGDALPEGAFVVGAVARNQERKRLDLTIAYFAEWLSTRGVEDAYLYLHIAPTGESAADLESLVAYYGLGKGPKTEGRVILSEPDLGVGIREDLMREVYSTMDLYVSTSQAEGWGLPALEAMACGVPCLLPNAHAFAEWTGKAAAGVECAETALTAPLNHRPYTIGTFPARDAFINGLDWLYRSPDKRVQFAARGQELAATFPWERTGEEMVEALEFALEPAESKREAQGA